MKFVAAVIPYGKLHFEQIEAEASTPYDADESAAADKEPSPLQQAALAIDALYGSNDHAPLHWQDKWQLKRGLRGLVRRLVMGLDLKGWKDEIPLAVEHYAILHYSKP